MTTQLATLVGPSPAFTQCLIRDFELSWAGKLSRSITTWRTEFLAYFHTGSISNGITEAVNLLIQESPARWPRVQKL